MKRNIAVILIVALLVTVTGSFPSEPTFAYTTLQLANKMQEFYPDENSAKAWLKSNHSQYSPSDKSSEISVEVLRVYKKVAYIKPEDNIFTGYKHNSDEMRYNPFTGREEPRTLGRDYLDQFNVTNDLFPDDAGGGTMASKVNKNWVEVKGVNAVSQRISNVVDDVQLDHLMTSKLSDTNNNSYVATNYTLLDVLSGKTNRNTTTMKNYFRVGSPPTVLNEGSVYLNHVVSGRTWYDTFDTPPLVGVFNPIITVTPDVTTVDFLEDETERMVNVIVKIDGSSISFPTAENLKSMSKEIVVSMEGQEKIVEFGTSKTVAQTVFKIPLRREQFKVGVEDEHVFKASMNITTKYDDDINDTAFSSIKVMVNAGDIEQNFSIHNAMASDEDITDSVLAYKAPLAQTNLTLKPSIDIYGDNEVTRILWGVRNSSGIWENFYDQTTNLGSPVNVSFGLNNANLASYMYGDQVTFRMVAFTKYRKKTPNGAYITSLWSTHTVQPFASIDPIPPKNAPPDAQMRAQTSVRAGSLFSFSAQKSSDEDGTIEDYDFSGFEIHSLKEGNRGKGISFNDGVITTRVRVTDNDGLTDSASKNITIKPALEAYMHIRGERKVNRKVILDGLSTQHGTYIDDYKYRWTVTPLEGQATSSIKFDTNAGKKVNYLFKEAGAYQVSLTVDARSTHPSSSATFSETISYPITIQTDVKPVADMNVVKTVLVDRQSKNATIELHDASYSVDGDQLTRRWYVMFDTNNDGLRNEPNWTYLGNTEILKYQTDKIGRYFFVNHSVDVINEADTMSVFLESADYLYDASHDIPINKRTCIVNNVAPVVMFSAETFKEIELAVITDTTGANRTGLLTEISNIEKYMSEKKITTDVNFIDMISKPKVSVGLKKNIVFKWVRRWYIDMAWDYYRRYDYSSANSNFPDYYYTPYEKVLVGGDIESRNGTVEQMLNFPTYASAYGTLPNNVGIHHDVTGAGRDYWQLNNLTATLYNAPNDYIATQTYQPPYDDVGTYDVAMMDSNVDFWVKLKEDYRFGSVDWSRSVNRWSNIENHADFPNIFMPKTMDVRVDSGWVQDEFISESSVSYNVAMLESYLSTYASNTNDKHLILAVENGEELFLTEELKEKIVNDYGFKVYVSIDDFWGEFSPKTPKAVDVEFENGALYAKTQYGNYLKNHSETVVDKLYYRYIDKKDEPIIFEDQLSPTLKSITPKLSGTAYLLKVRGYQQARRVSLLNSRFGSYYGNGTYYDGVSSTYDSQIKFTTNGSFWYYSAIPAAEYLRYTIGETWTLNSGQVLPTVRKVYENKGANLIAETDDGIYYVSNNVTDSSYDFDHQKGIKININGVSEVYAMESRDLKLSWNSRFSTSWEEPHYGHWEFLEDDTPMFMIKDNDGKYALCYLDTTSYNTPYNGEVRGIRSTLRVKYFSDLSQFKHERVDILENLYTAINFSPYPHQITKAPWYLDYKQLMTEHGGWNSRVYYNAYRVIISDYVNRTTGYNNHIDTWMLVDDNGTLFKNGKFVSHNVKAVDFEVSQTDARYAYVSTEGKVYGKGTSPTGQLGMFTDHINKEASSYQEVFESPFTLNATYSSKNYGSVYDLTSNHPAYYLVDMGAFSELTDAIEKNYESQTNTQDIYILKGESVRYDGMYFDRESHPIYDVNYDFDHNPNYFDNTEGVYSPVVASIYAPIQFNKPGLYKMKPSYRDNPVGTDNLRDEYRLWSSTDARVNVYVHRKPVAMMTYTTAKLSDSVQRFTFSDAGSYDLDHSKSRADKGIVETQWRYKEEFDPSYLDFTGFIDLKVGHTYSVGYRVKDLEGAWSDWKTETLEIKKDYYGLTAYSNPSYPDSIHAGGNIVFFADVNTTKAISKVTVTLGPWGPHNMVKQGVTGITEKYMFTWGLGTSLADGDYSAVVTAYAVDGSTLTQNLTVKVLTPIGIEGTMSSYNVEKGDTVTFTATTPVTASRATSVALYGTGKGVFKELTLINTTATQKTWQGSAVVNSALADGEYFTRFYAATLNGRSSEDRVDFDYWSNLPPTVHLNWIQPATISRGSDVTISWTPNDDDGDLLSMVGEYSKDGGLSWIRMGTHNYVPSGNAKGFTISDVNGENYLVRVTVTDPHGDSVTDQQSFSVQTNQPPRVVIHGYSPNTLYEGDTVTIEYTPSDPDGGNVDVQFELSNDGVNYWTTQNFTSLAEGVQYSTQITDLEAATYYFRVTVKDAHSETGQALTDFTVGSLEVSGLVNHVEQWNENRMAFNKTKTGTIDLPRTYNMFWPGERFMLLANTTELSTDSNLVCESVNVEILTHGMEVYLDQSDERPSALNNWTGEVWEESMMGWKSSSITFRFIAHFSNGMVKTHDVTIEIDDSEDYWLYHRLF